MFPPPAGISRPIFQRLFPFLSQVANPRRNRSRHWFAGSACIFGLILSSGLVDLAEAQVPRGVFSLGGAGGAAPAPVLANPDVLGLSVRQDWAELEPAEGDFNFTFLEAELQAAADAGKIVLLRINTQAHKPAWVTQAVTDAGGTFYTFDDNGTSTTIPVFWDPTYLAKKKNMIAAVGSHFADHSALKIVSTSFANAASEDWNVPHTTPEVSEWFAVGYTTEKMQDAGQQIIDAAMTALPNQFVTLSIGGNGHSKNNPNLEPTATYLAQSVVARARTTWPGRLLVQVNSLSTINPAAPGPDDSVWNLLWMSQPDVAAQMVWNCSADASYRVNGGVPGDPAEILSHAVDSGISYGVDYVEIYEVDVRNLTDAISYAHNALTAVPTPLPVQLVNMVSTKVHGEAGSYEIDLTDGNGVECRSGGAAGDYQIILTFSNDLTNVDSASATCGSVSSSAIGPNANQYTVNLTGLNDCNQQYHSLVLSSVSDSAGNQSAMVTGPQWGLLIGDTTGDHSVNSADVGQTKSQSGSVVSSSNLRQDVNADGNLNSGDVGFVKSKSGTGLPSSERAGAQ